MAETKLGLFSGEDMPTIESGWKLFQKGVEFNTAIKLDETVKANENFYIGKQWEGIEANGMPTPQVNYLKRVVGFIVATVTTDNIKVNASPLAAMPQANEFTSAAEIVNAEFDAIMERNRLAALLKEFARNAAVDGDGCLYSYWDDGIETGQTAKGGIKTEIIENNRVFFGNPNDRRVESQPYIIIAKREMLRNAKLRAQANGIGTWEDIAADDEATGATDNAKLTDGKVTDLTLLWRNEETGSIWSYEFTEKSAIEEPKDTNLKHYPIVWLNWDYIQDCYHGQAMLTGLLPNQKFVNRMWAMTQISLMKTAYPKVLYDKTRIAHWDNRVGAAIGIQGGDINSVARSIEPPAISPQVAQAIQLMIEQTEQSLGATSVALGDTRPDNTSAIIALQRAAATPTELTKQNLYQCVEDMFRIYLDFMSEYYGRRQVNIDTPDDVRAAAEFGGNEVKVPNQIGETFDFSVLRDHPMKLKLDVGASSYYSEIASIQTLDNLLRLEKVDTVQYLERIPDGYIPGRRALINDIKAKQMAMQNMMPAQTPENSAPEAAPTSAGGSAAVGAAIPTGGGYSNLQRQINETGNVPV